MVMELNLSVIMLMYSGRQFGKDYGDSTWVGLHGSETESTILSCLGVDLLTYLKPSLSLT